MKPLIEVIHDKIVIPKDDDTDLTIEIKQHIKSDLDSQYQSDEMSSLLDTCAFLDPRFKDKFTMEDERVVTLMNEIKYLMKLKEQVEWNNQQRMTHLHHQEKRKI